MSNIINIDDVAWQSEDYEESYLEGKIHQHLVKEASYISSKSPVNTTDTNAPPPNTDVAFSGQSIGAYEYAPGGWISDHIHSNAEQWYFIITGKSTMKVGDEEKICDPGTIVFIPRNTIHSYKVIGDEPLKILNIATFFPDKPSVTTRA